MTERSTTEGHPTAPGKLTPEDFAVIDRIYWVNVGKRDAKAHARVPSERPETPEQWGWYREGRAFAPEPALDS